MGVWLTPDTVQVYDKGTADDHGRVAGRGALRWSGFGSLDLDRPVSDPTRSDGSTFSPIVRPTGRLHLAETADVEPGCVAVVRDQEWVITAVENVVGPYVESPMDETACTVAAGDWWS